MIHAIVSNEKGAEQHADIRFASERRSSHVMLDFQLDLQA
jgi:hypothetical protein